MSEADLENYRKEQNWTYGDLAQWLGVTQAASARRYALGIQMLNAKAVLDACLKAGGRISPLAMYRRHFMAKTGGIDPATIAAGYRAPTAAQGGLTSGTPGPSCAPPSHAPAIRHDSHEQEHRP
ncbi:MAG: hypothetical protein HQL45_15700 [Alphaproteobacteria bacterium]|nr:hypothetical protein [Alphaproteobacteria bacterium]